MLLVDNSAQILRLVDRDMNSFFKLLKLKQVGKYSASVHLPRYKRENEISTYFCCGRNPKQQYPSGMDGFSDCQLTFQ